MTTQNISQQISLFHLPGSAQSRTCPSLRCRRTHNPTRSRTFFLLHFPLFLRARCALLLSWSRKGTDQRRHFSHEEDFSYDHCRQCSLSSTSRRLPVAGVARVYTYRHCEMPYTMTIITVRHSVRVINPFQHVRQLSNQ